MAIYSLNLNDFECNDCVLLAVYTTLRDYKLAYMLNKGLSYSFKKSGFSLNKVDKNDVKASFSVYEYFGEAKSIFLVKNTFRNTLSTNGIGLFSEYTSRHYLIPEQKKVDYFLKLEGDLSTSYVVDLLVRIKKLPLIITSYEIDINSLKSKDFLIF